MAWRWLTGAPVSRHGSISCDLALAAALVSRPRTAKFCSHRRIDWDALRDVVDDAGDGEVIPRRFDHYPAGREKPVPVARPQRGPQGTGVSLALWIDLVLPKQRILEIYLNIAELGPSGQFGAQAGAIYASTIRP